MKNVRGRAGRNIVFLILGLLILMAISIWSQLVLPKPTGPFAIGRASLHWTDASRPEALTDNPNDFREVPVEIWYPAEADSGVRAPYFRDLDPVARGLAGSGEVTPFEVFGLRLIRSREFLDASIATDSTDYPVVFLSPGNGTNVEFYAGIADELASHGYIVVGINHPYDVAAVLLQDGSVAQFISGPLELDERPAWVAERIAQRTADVLFALAKLEALNASNDAAFGRHFDFTHVAVMGHSLGGITAAEACRATFVFRACLNLDGLQIGGPFSASAPPSETIPPRQPFMMITKEAELDPAITALFEAIPSGSYRVVVNGAEHDNFTDGPLLVPSLLPISNKANRILSLTRKYTLAFFDQTLKGQISPLLEESHRDGRVLLEVYPPR